MAKRARKQTVVSDDEEFVLSDASYKPSKSTRGPKGGSTQRKKRRVVKADVISDSDEAEQVLLEEEGDEAVESGSKHAQPHALSTHTIENSVPLRKALLRWYADVHESRGMPWRKPYDPSFSIEQRAQRAYEVWVSEIMLQQTQVVTVIPYYNKWMAKFPTIKDLASSDIEAVNALWKGLGYYSRAARLLSAAKKVVSELGGRLPDNAKDMESKIPGIGRYSAGAICSIAYNQCAPVLDGNVHRLLSRVLALYAPPKAKSTLDILWAAATAMVESSDRPGDINQALIELGATVCKVRDPDCGSCPLRAWCRAYQYEHSNDKPNEQVPSGVSENFTENSDVPDIEELCRMCEPLPVNGLVTTFPMKVERKKAREELDIVNVVEWRHRECQDRWFLLVRRPEGGLLAGLHEFPTLPAVSGSLSASAMHDVAHRLLSELLASPPLPYARTATQQRNGDAAARAATTANSNDLLVPSAESLLRITSVRSAGDITHIFSHIKKTYRVQWVVLEGGGRDPPSLSPRQAVIGGTASERTTHKVKHKRAQDEQATRTNKSLKPMAGTAAAAAAATTTTTTTTRVKSSRASSASKSTIRNDDPLSITTSTTASPCMTSPESTSTAHAMWVLLGDVADANISTGVLKVWRQVCSLWDGDVHTQGHGERADWE